MICLSWNQALKILPSSFCNSEHYFKSKNCRREIYSAIRQKKPIVLVYEGGAKTIENMKKECKENCDGTNEDSLHSPGSSTILQTLLSNEEGTNNNSILWLDENEFSQASLNFIYSHILRHLPYYVKNPKELENGISVVGEIQPMRLQTQTNLLVYRQNQGSAEYAKEIKDSLGKYSDSITICDASEYLETCVIPDNEEDSNLDNPTYLLLNLNKDTFNADLNEDIEQTSILKKCLDHPEIKVILLREKDDSKGAVEFDYFFKHVPTQLISGEPYNLFSDIAIPVHPIEEYRTVAWRQILRKMGAKPY